MAEATHMHLFVYLGIILIGISDPIERGTDNALF